MSGDKQNIAQVDLDDFGIEEDANGVMTKEAIYRRKVADVSADDRNRLQEAIIASSESNCAEFRRNLFAFNGARKVSLESTAIILAGAATAVGGTAAKSALAAAATAVLGVDQTIDANILQSNAIDLILHTIAGERALALTDMRTQR